MQKEKPTKVYTGSKSQKPKKPKKQSSDFLNTFVKSARFVINKAMAGSVQHIAILVAAAVLVVAVVGGAVWGIASLAGGNGEGPNVNEIEIDPEADNNYDKDANVIDTSKFASTILQETEDAGQQYITETLFVGDSNTVRSLMYDVTGNTWENVVGAVGIGIQHVVSDPVACVTFTQPTDPVDIVTAIKWIQPKRVVFTFGTNNASWAVDSFIEEYEKAVDAAYEAYPYFDVIINAIPPVDKVRDYPNVTMQQIDAFNAALAQMCEDKGYKFLNSAEALKDDTTGFAKKDYTISDGIHLSKNGFTALFDYIRTHAYETEDRRPELTYCPKRNEVEMPTILQDPVAIRGGLKVIFTSNDYSLGSVDGEVEQYVKYTKTSDAVTAIAKSDAEFTGWSCEYGGISDPNSSTITFTAPMLDESITEVRVVANFKKNKPDPTPTPTPTPTATPTPGVLEKITIKEGETATVKKGATINLTVVANPAGAKLSTVEWTSDKPEIAKITVKNGEVTGVEGVSAGTAVIKVTTNGGKLSASCTVTVTSDEKPMTGISVASSLTTIEVGGTTTVKATKAPADTTDKTAIEFTSSNTSVATVDKTSGVVTGKAAGTTEITAKCGSYSHKITITVTNAHEHTGGNATCKEKAKCSLCGKEYGDLLTTHTWSDATCKAPKTCSVCGKIEGDKAAHTPGAAATCGVAQTCTVCGTEIAAATGAHTWKDANCTTAKTCSVCGATEGSALGHTPGDGPTCTTAQTCKVCGVEITGAAGHSYSESVTSEPTCSSAGEKAFTCSKCQDSYKETIGAKGHSYADGKCSSCGEAEPAAAIVED